MAYKLKVAIIEDVVTTAASTFTAIDVALAYGLDAPRGLLTPFTGVAYSENAETWRAGVRWKLGASTEVSLEASLKEPTGDEDPESGVLLKDFKRW